MKFHKEKICRNQFIRFRNIFYGDHNSVAIDLCWCLMRNNKRRIIDDWKGIEMKWAD